MNKTIKIAAVLTSLLSASFALACDYPDSPKDLPNGTTASKEEMLDGVRAIAAYQESMSTYLDCIEANEVVAVQSLGDDDETKQQRKSMFDKRYNAAVEEQTRTVERFNAEIRAYKAR